MAGPDSLVLQVSNGDAKWVQINSVATHLSGPRPGLGSFGTVYHNNVRKLLFDLVAVKECSNIAYKILSLLLAEAFSRQGAS